MHVLGEAVVGVADRHHGAEAGRPQGGDLQAGEASPGNAVEARAAAAPWLGDRPFQHRQAVGLLLRQVLVLEDAVAVAAAAQVDADHRIAVAGHPGVRDGVALGGEVATAVGNRLQDRRYRVGLGVRRHPDPRRQPDAVGHLDPDRVALDDRAGKVVGDPHQPAPWRHRFQASRA